MIREKYNLSQTESYDVCIWPAKSDGKRYPVVLLIHGNFGLVEPYGKELMSMADQIANLGYVAILPSYYQANEFNPADTNIDGHVPAILASIDHIKKRSDVDLNRLGLVGFSLGGGIAMSLIQSKKREFKVLVDFYGFVKPKVANGVEDFPPTIIFHNSNDEIVPAWENSEPFANELWRRGIEHEPMPPIKWYDDLWPRGANHAFKPGGTADQESRTKTLKWLTDHLPATGKL